MPDNIQNKLQQEVAVMRNEIANIKETNLASQKQNTCEHTEIKTALSDIDKKLDRAMEQKADKEEVKDLRDKSWQIILAIIVAFIGLIATAIKAFGGKL